MGQRSAQLRIGSGLRLAVARERGDQSRINGELSAVPEGQAIAHDLNRPGVADRHINVHVSNANIARNTRSGLATDTGKGMLERQRPSRKDTRGGAGGSVVTMHLSPSTLPAFRRRWSHKRCDKPGKTLHPACLVHGHRRKPDHRATQAVIAAGRSYVGTAAARCRRQQAQELTVSAVSVLSPDENGRAPTDAAFSSSPPNLAAGLLNTETVQFLRLVARHRRRRPHARQPIIATVRGQSCTSSSRKRADRFPPLG